MSSTALLTTLESTLRRIEALTPFGKQAWDGDEVRWLVVERLWIAAGNLAEADRKTAELPPGAELYGFRSVLAHALPADISSDRVWHETSVELPWLLEQVHPHGA